MKDLILLGAFGIAVVDWVSTAKKNKNIEKFAKPLTMLLLLIWVLTSAAQGNYLGNHSLIWLVVGIGFCLVGDIFLFLPPEVWFLRGLIAFLLGHVGYIFSFGVSHVAGGQVFPGLVLGLSITIAGIYVVRRLVAGLKQSGKGKMSVPIMVYAVVISYVLFSAGFKFLDSAWSLSESLLLAVGALLFYISDILNAWERFVSKFKNDRLIIMITYHLGQFGIALGVINYLAANFSAA